MLCGKTNETCTGLQGMMCPKRGNYLNSRIFEKKQGIAKHWSGDG